jgi:hypothetical protein
LGRREGTRNPTRKITKPKKGWGQMTQVVEHLPRKHKALRSNPNTAKKKKDLVK